ncbi:MAG: DUF805 domain-containing protein [Elusimicrobia bacterium]|jgi:uncharacterized membrane protein YhaH (DUF805 family)|nr:DUF805 domain-containing protein [Elusimicrobiota bacterium]
MNYVNAYFLDIITKHFFDFNGKEGRKVFWLFTLNCFIVSLILGAISSTISYIFSLVVLLPSLGILVRRLRDAGFSPWLALLLIVPVVGWIAVVILACFPSK